MPSNTMGSGLPPIRIPPPAASAVTLRQSGPPTATVVPIGGAVSGLRSFTVDVTTPTLLVQAVHGMTFEPAGITVTDTYGDPFEYAAVTYPTAGVVEIRFGVPFTGKVRLS